MFVAEWTPDRGWYDARITPYGPFSLDPATAVLHYAQEVFEGMKAYRHDDGSIWTFRPEANAERMVRSSQRLALPVLDVADFLQAVDALVTVEQRWVPDNAGEKSLYIRPFMFASEAFLGVRPAKHVTFAIILSPAPTSPRASSRSTCGCPPTTPGPDAAAWERPRRVATTPPASSRSSRRWPGAATRWSSSTPRRGPTSRSSGA
jgi:branched-subunit amino acid aminotransferase/4-amino-4-deoxychorismate lyase